MFKQMFTLCWRYHHSFNTQQFQVYWLFIFFLQRKKPSLSAPHENQNIENMLTLKEEFVEHKIKCVPKYSSK
jgi:hypothetical protein